MRGNAFSVERQFSLIEEGGVLRLFSRRFPFPDLTNATSVELRGDPALALDTSRNWEISLIAAAWGGGIPVKATSFDNLPPSVLNVRGKGIQTETGPITHTLTPEGRCQVTGDDYIVRQSITERVRGKANRDRDSSHTQSKTRERMRKLD